MTFSNKILTIMVLFSLGLSVLGLIALAMASPRGRMGQSGGQDLRMNKAIRDQAQAIGKLQQAVQQLHGDDRKIADVLQGAMQRVGLIRFDAFEDIGGSLSFSAALLDAGGSGMVITSINGRTDTRCYAKPVTAGESRFNLSEEEAEAIRLAMAEPVTARVS